MSNVERKVRGFEDGLSEDFTLLAAPGGSTLLSMGKKERVALEAPRGGQRARYPAQSLKEIGHGEAELRKGLAFSWRRSTKG